MRENVITSKSDQPKFYHEALKFRGPVRNRSCTDVIWLLLFLVLLPSWGYVGYHSMTRYNTSVLHEIFQPNSNSSDVCSHAHESSCNEFILMAREMLNDAAKSRFILLGGLIIVVSVCGLYTILLRWAVVIVIWASIVEWLTLQGYSIYVLYDLYANANWNIAYLICDAVLLLFFLIMVIVLRKRLKQAIKLIREGSKLVHAIKSTLLVPLWVGSINVGLFFYAAVVALHLYITHLSSQNDSKITLLTLFCVNILSLMWTWLFMNSMADMIYATTFCSWYWEPDKNKIHFFVLIAATLKTIRYHLGTVALGSMILALTRFFRFGAELIIKLGEYVGSALDFIGNFLRCFCAFFDEFITFINKNAFVMCALHGTSFYKSANDASNVIVEQAATSIIIDKMVDYIFFFNKLLISITAGLGLKLIQEWDYFCQLTSLEPLTYSLAPPILLGVTTYFLTTLFFSAYIMAIETLYICHLQDYAVNDGTPGQPYLMTANIRRIFKK